MVIVHQRNDGGLQRILAEVPGGTPGEMVIGEVGHMCHLLHPEVAGMRQQAGIEVGQERRPQPRGVGRMDKMAGKMRPGIDLNEEFRKAHPGQPLGNALG